MQNPGDTDDSEKPASDADMRFRHNEEQSNDEKWNDVLQIIQMRSTASLNVFVCLHLKALAETAVFRVAHRLSGRYQQMLAQTFTLTHLITHVVLASMINCQHCH